MYTTITTCQSCGCDILNERMTKGRLKKWCSESCRAKWRYENDPVIKDRNTYTEQKARGYSNKWKALQYKGSKCQTCGESRPATLCFHHRDPSEKKIRLDSRTFSITKLKLLLEEIDKCDLLCHNCHQELHNADGWKEFFNKQV